MPKRPIDPEELTAAAVLLDQRSLEEELKCIAQLTHYQMAWLHRYAPFGHHYFIIDTPEDEAFHKRFEELGGMTSEISKQLRESDPLGNSTETIH